MKQYQEFKPEFFTWNNLSIFLFGVLFGSFAYKGGDLVVAISVATLYIGAFIISNRVAFNNDNIEALHEEIEKLKEKID